MKHHFIGILLILLLPVCLSAQNKHTVSGRSKSKNVNVQFKRNTSSPVKYYPDLTILEKKFMDENQDNRLEPFEQAEVSLRIMNRGKEAANDVTIALSLKNQTYDGLNFAYKKHIGNIQPNESRTISVPVYGEADLESGSAYFSIEVQEKYGFNAIPEQLVIETKAGNKPELIVVHKNFTTDYGGKIKLNYPVNLDLGIKNIGSGIARDVKAELSFVNENCIDLGEGNIISFGNIESNIAKTRRYIFTATSQYDYSEIPIRVNITQANSSAQLSELVSVSLNDYLPAGEELANIETPVPAATDTYITPDDVDIIIPGDTVTLDHVFCLIIGNEDYSKYQPGLTAETNVAFARNDAEIFKKYATLTLGIPEKNIIYLIDATAAEMKRNLELVSKMLKTYGPQAELVFYYSGHGLPDEYTRIPYLIPVDVPSTDLKSALQLSEVYSQLSESGAKKITVFLDACFSGGGRETGLLAARGFKVIPKNDKPSGNLVVFAATSGNQSALPYKEMNHGMFTYFLLKKLQETKGYITYQELFDYLKFNVSLESLRINRKEQEPQVNISPQLGDEWKNLSLK